MFEGDYTVLCSMPVDICMSVTMTKKRIMDVPFFTVSLEIPEKCLTQLKNTKLDQQ